MMTSLHHWLTTYRERLLPRWQSLAAAPALAAHAGNGHTAQAAADNGGAPPQHPGERAILLASLYDALIEAADQLLAGSGSPAQLTWVRR